jgi:hypothetical protein
MTVASRILINDCTRGAVFVDCGGLSQTFVVAVEILYEGMIVHAEVWSEYVFLIHVLWRRKEFKSLKNLIHKGYGLTTVADSLWQTCFARDWWRRQSAGEAGRSDRQLDQYICVSFHVVWRVWRYQRGNQNPYIEEEQTTQWPKEKVQKNKQRSTKHTYKTKDRVTRTPLKTGGELMCSRRVRSSFSTSDIRRVNLVTNPVISHERGKDREVLTTSGAYLWHRYSITVNQVMVATVKLSKWWLQLD